MNSSIDYFKDLSKIVHQAIIEDVGSGDITAQLVPEDQIVSAKVITRENAVVCGRPWFDEVFKQIDGRVSITWLVNEGDEVSSDQTLLELYGSARSILTAERGALNFLQTLMATATTSRKYSSFVTSTNTKILDTRKTIPGLRLAQKYAVKTGGCDNHRIGLYDAFLIKENHIEACGSITKAAQKARDIMPGALIEVEVENIDELEEAIVANVDRVMLDNFSGSDLDKALELKPPKLEYEISGNLDENSISKFRLEGVDYISSGALTKNCQAIDLSMRIYSD